MSFYDQFKLPQLTIPETRTKATDKNPNNDQKTIPVQHITKLFSVMKCKANIFNVLKCFPSMNYLFIIILFVLSTELSQLIWFRKDYIFNNTDLNSWAY